MSPRSAGARLANDRDMTLDVNALRASFSVAAQDPDLVPRFYTLLFERYPSVRPLFGDRITPRQRDMLTKALINVVERLDDPEPLLEDLRTLGARHVKYGVVPEMYPWVGECLLATLSASLGDSWTPRVEAAWTTAYGVIASTMMSGAEHGAPAVRTPLQASSSTPPQSGSAA